MAWAGSERWSTPQRGSAVVSLGAFAAAVAVACWSARAWVVDDPAWLGPGPWVVPTALLVGFLALLPVRHGPAEVGSALLVFLLFAVPAVVGTAVTTAAVQDVRQWLRTDERVKVTLGDCHHSGSRTSMVNDTPITDDVYSCTYSWSVGGRSWEQVRETDQNHRNGFETELWADRSSGELADHDAVGTAFIVFLSGAVDLVALIFAGGIALALHDSGVFRGAGWADAEDPEAPEAPEAPEGAEEPGAA